MKSITASKRNTARLQIDNFLYTTTDELDALLVGKDHEQLNIFNNLSAEAWEPTAFDPTSLSAVPNSYTPNPNLWCRSLSSQLTGFHMFGGLKFEDGSLRVRCQQFGMTLITPQHIITHAHAGWPPIGSPVWYVSADGTQIFKTTYIRRVLYPDHDMYVGLLADKAPDWICHYDIITIPLVVSTRMLALRLPGIAVSQGVVSGYDPITYPHSNTPKNRKVYLRGIGSAYDYYPGTKYYDWAHQVSDGDSGTPHFYLYNGKLYLMGMVGALLFSSITTIESDINSLITEVDIAEHAENESFTPTGYTVTAFPLPIDI